MRTLVLYLVFVVTSFATHAQYSSQPIDSLRNNNQLVIAALTIKLQNPTIQTDFTSINYLEGTRGFYIKSHTGMYEQYNLSDMQATRLPAWKGHYPQSPLQLQYDGNHLSKDSFNPHGSADIGSALINGVLNGIIFGNKY
ncbi:MAG: hypothetical protein JEZ14_14225 [Marinilabiliaceae bacterium]|nr:hypothetical protein [Marinilabiliaceae bacterium]